MSATSWTRPSTAVPGSLDDDENANNINSRNAVVEPISCHHSNDVLQPTMSSSINNNNNNNNNNNSPLVVVVISSEPRSQSAQSLSSSSTLSGDICRICHCESAVDLPLIIPCYCNGSLKFVHQKCLQIWIKSSQTRSCEVCRYSFVMQTKLKPLRKWEKLNISSIERRKILCSVTFHIVAITCVVWSLYVLIDRTVQEVRRGDLQWPFWTKLVVVGVGFTGGLVFMYVQCKLYVHLFRRWKAYNKVVYVQDCPEKITRRGLTSSFGDTNQRDLAVQGKNAVGAIAS